MKKETKDKLKSLWLVRWIIMPMIIQYRNRKNRRCYRWMTKQMNMIDPAQDDRQKYWMKCGVHSNGHFRVGYGVYFDAINANHITIEDGVWITSECLLLCHRRKLNDYRYGDDYNKLPYKIEPIVLKKGCCIGMKSIIMPGVVIGEGAIIGTGSVVTKDIPPYCVAVGNPAKPVKFFDKHHEESAD